MMNKKIKEKLRWGLLPIAVFCSLALGAQQSVSIKLSPVAQIEATIGQLERAKMMQTMEEVLTSYANLAKMIDPEMGRVNQSSTSKFKRLFTPGASIFRDYLEIIPEGREMEKVDDYSIAIFNGLTLNGVEFNIEEAVLTKIETDPTGVFYAPVVEVTKVLGNMIDENNNEAKIVSGNRLVLKFTFDIFKENLERATIAKIESNDEVKVVDYFTRLIGISGGAGTSVYNLETSNFWDNEHGSSKLESTGGLNYSMGFEYVTDRFITSSRSDNRKLVLSGGLHYSSYQINTNLGTFSIDGFDATAYENPDMTGDSQNYTRIVESVTVEEKLRFSVLEIPVGVGYNVFKNQNTTFYLHARAIPGIVLGGTGSIAGDASYDGILQYEEEPGVWVDSGFQLMGNNAVNNPIVAFNDDDQLGPYNVGSKSIDLDSDPLLAGTTLALKLSPTAYIKFSEHNPGWGLMVALDIGYQFGSFIEHNPIDDREDEAFKFEDDYEGSLLDYYTNNLSAMTFGIRLGLMQRARLDP